MDLWKIPKTVRDVFEVCNKNMFKWLFYFFLLENATKKIDTKKVRDDKKRLQEY